MRSEDGCPWDRAQDHESIQENMLEEAYEAVDAIQCRDDAKLCEELGDVLMQVVFHAQLAAERGAFDYSDVVSGISKADFAPYTSLRRRLRSNSRGRARHLDQKQKLERNYDKTSQMLTDVPRSMPALMRAAKLQKACCQNRFRLAICSRGSS